MFERWVKAYEKLLDWEWSDDPYILAFWVKLLLMVNVKNKRWHGRIIKRGLFLEYQWHLCPYLRVCRLVSCLSECSLSATTSRWSTVATG